MRTAKTVSVTLSSDLLSKAQKMAARERRTVSEVIGEAVRRYVGVADLEWRRLLGRARAKGRLLGIKNEADVERLSDEYRREKRR